MKMRIVALKQAHGNLVGYGLLDETTYSFGMVDIKNTVALIHKHGCVNAELKNGVIVGTECNLDTFPVFNHANELTDNNGIFVLGRIVKDNETIGYKFATPFGKVQSFDMPQALAIASRTKLINGILVPDSYIKGKNFNLPVIEEPKTKTPSTLTHYTQDVKENCEDTDAINLNYVAFESLVYDKLDSPHMPQFLNQFIGFNHYDKGIMTNQALAWAYVKRPNKSVNDFIKILEKMPEN